MTAAGAGLSQALSFSMYSFAAIGAFAHWLLQHYGRSFDQGIGDFIDEILGDLRIKVLVQVLIFVGLGALISVVMVIPMTERQALAAGMAWTSLLGGLAPAGKRKGRNG
ncbi:MAG TPA: hypothetical protein VFW28_16965 [Micropepsaceae bacterium]|nr:hypothetical protein [Micropepsaceae bacterium]